MIECLVVRDYVLVARVLDEAARARKFHTQVHLQRLLRITHQRLLTA